jgi:allantoinase
LYFSAEEVPSSNTLFKCTPPIREKENNELLWNGIENGIIDLVVTDHSPAPLSMKQGAGIDFSNAWGGISSLQFSLPAFWTKARGFGLNIQDVCRLMCEKPAELIGQVGIKGTLAIGADADLTIWNPDSPVSTKANEIHYKHQFTPFEDQPLVGRVHQTYIGGGCAYQDGDFVSLQRGKLVLNQ